MLEDQFLTYVIATVISIGLGLTLALIVVGLFSGCKDGDKKNGNE